MTRRKEWSHAYPIDKGSSMNRYWAPPRTTPKYDGFLKTPKIINKILVLIIFIITNLSPSYAYAVSVHKQDMWKIYLHMKVVSDKQYRCVSRLWYLESRWNNKSKNSKSTAYGIAQVLGTKTSDPYKQIDAGLKYIAHRFNNDGCKALAYHLKHGHY